MAQPSLAEMAAAAATADGPGVTPPGTPKFGGVDPLGLRQVNFDLMDQVLPSLNNVARHIRPFVVVAWAWRRANRLAEAQGYDRIHVDALRDFVDRIEVIYTWSQFLRDPNADLPGRQVLEDLVQAERWTFGGSAWAKRREGRQYSTSLMAPINYGPALKMLGWVEPHRKYMAVLIPTEVANPALDALEERITGCLEHPAFNAFGSVTVTAAEVRPWSAAWALNEVTDAEARVMADMLFGAKAPLTRRRGGALLLAAARHASTTDVARLRSTMAGTPSNFVPPTGLAGTMEVWRRVQVRQLFRLALEALLYWIMLRLKGERRGTDALVDAFLGETSTLAGGTNARAWLEGRRDGATGPTMLMDRVELALNDPSAGDLASSIADALAFCIAEAPDRGEDFERADRLPLFRARREANAWGAAPVGAFVRHVVESWVLAQHVYWSVGRGLADARARGKTLLRLKVILEEGGWTLAPGVSHGAPPVPTADRLQTAVSLAQECGLLI